MVNESAGACTKLAPGGLSMIARTAIVAAFLAAPFILPHAAIAETIPAHDGQWAVEIVTEKGWCDVYRWNIGVAGGRITQVGAPGAVANGSIDPKGRVSVQLARGSDIMSVTGSIVAKTGSGAWVLPNRSCAGHWSAQKLA
jgi:hypothetical protein